MNHHLEKHGLIQREQRGTREKCNGTFDNLLIDRMVCQDSQSVKRNLSMAWVDVRKAFDTTDHRWLGGDVWTSKIPSVVKRSNMAID